MKRTNSLIAAFTFILVLIVLSGCFLIQTQKYSITFDADGGSTVSAQLVEENEKATRPADPTKVGYTFDNWYAEDTFATVWNFDTPITEDTTLYAKWIADSYTVTFDSQGATTNANPTSKTVTSPSTTIDELPTAPEKTGYTFGGWFTEEEGGGSEFTASTEVTDDITVYAKWMITLEELKALITNNEDVTSVNTSAITDMSDLFRDNATFNQSISDWDVSSVTDMRYMFYEATSFNQDISSWDVSSVTDMRYMFAIASSFNGDISGWDVSNVTDMVCMFFIADAFNGDISNWDVSSVTDMSGMFNSADAFNQDISDWDVSSVTDMRYMFNSADAFNQDISDWDVSSVTDYTGFSFGGCPLIPAYHPNWND